MIVSSGARRPKIAMMTNGTTNLSLPLTEQLASSPRVELCDLLFFDSLRAERKRWRRHLRAHGMRYVVEKGANLLTRRIRAWRSKGRGAVAAAASTYEFAVARGLPCAIVPDLNAPSVVARLEQSAPDIVLVASCSQILRPQTLSVPTVAAINVHPSLLPRHRGPLPTFWTLHDGDEEAGITFHLMTERFDEGDVVAQFRVPVEQGESDQALAMRLFALAGRHVEDVLADVVAGRAVPKRQQASQATYEPFPNRNDRRRLAERR